MFEGNSREDSMIYQATAKPENKRYSYQKELKVNAIKSNGFSSDIEKII